MTKQKLEFQRNDIKRNYGIETPHESLKGTYRNHDGSRDTEIISFLELARETGNIELRIHADRLLKEYFWEGKEYFWEE